MLALLLVLVAAVPAFAVPPVPTSGLTDDDFSLFTCPQQGSQQEFVVYNHDVGQHHEKAFYDKAGTLVRASGNRTGSDNLHREGDFSKVLSHQYGMSWHWDYTDQQAKITGSIMNIHLPDGGIVFKSTGQTLLDTTTDPGKLSSAPVWSTWTKTQSAAI